MVLVGDLGEVALALEAAGVLAGAVQAEHERHAPPGAQPLGHVDDDRGRAREDAQAVVAAPRGTTAHGSPTSRGARAGRRRRGRATRRRLPPPQRGDGQRHQHHAPRRASRATLPPGAVTAAVIMPAPTVSFVASSMRMNEPVERLRA